MVVHSGSEYKDSEQITWNYPAQPSYSIPIHFAHLIICLPHINTFSQYIEAIKGKEKDD
jgi:predicted nucleotide-binding protein (sugar kinase/HSP70/actin superfamily)